MAQEITGADQIVAPACRDGEWYWYDGRGEGENGWPTAEAALAGWRANPIDDSENASRPAWLTDAAFADPAQPGVMEMTAGEDRAAGFRCPGRARQYRRPARTMVPHLAG
jgi:hypothetical protein